MPGKIWKRPPVGWLVCYILVGGVHGGVSDGDDTAVAVGGSSRSILPHSTVVEDRKQQNISKSKTTSSNSPPFCMIVVKD